MTGHYHIVPQYSPVIGGAQDYCAHLSEALVAAGSPVTVLTSRLSSRDIWENDLPRWENVNGVQVRRFSALKRGRVTWRIYHWCRRRYLSQPRTIYELGLMLAQGPVSLDLPYYLMSHRQNAALVHLFGLFSAFVGEAFWAARAVHLPIIITPFVHTTPPVGLDMIWKRQTLKLANHVVAMTLSEKKYLEHEIGLQPQQVSVVSPGLEPSDYPKIAQTEARRQLALPDDAFIMLFIGRKELYKGIQTLYQAYRELQDSHKKQFCLVLIGPDVISASSSWEQKDSVIDLGEVDHATKLLALSACDCLVLPSTSESFGIVILEAWAAAKPVVVTRLPSTQDVVIDGEDGFLFEVGDVTQLVGALSRLAEDRALALKMGHNGHRKFLAEYTLATMTARMQQIYDSLDRGRESCGSL